MQSGDRRSQIAILVAGAAVAFALVGTALAGPEAIVRAVSKSQVKKIAKKQANAVVDSRAANLNVNSAKTATSATSALDSAKLDGQPPSAFAPSAVEPYHEVGASGQPPFGSGWSNDNPSQTSTAFYKDPFGVVHVKGIAEKAAGAITIFSLPTGYRPTRTACFPTLKAAPPTPTYICVYATGAVDLIPATGDGAYLLDGITFRAG